VAVKDRVFDETEWYATLKIQVALARHGAMRNDRGMVNTCRASKRHGAVLQPWMAGILENCSWESVGPSDDIFYAAGKIDLDMTFKTI
jgi:hypothetical protein